MTDRQTKAKIVDLTAARYTVILDRVEPDQPPPPYCIHGRTVCRGGCEEWCWLGKRTFDIVYSGQAIPLCRQCAARLVPPHTPVVANLADPTTHD